MGGFVMKYSGNGYILLYISENGDEKIHIILLNSFPCDKIALFCSVFRLANGYH